MADFLGDVIRVFLDTKEQFTGEALKLKQVGVCRNVGLSKGHEFVARDHDGLYYTVESAQVQSNWTATDTGSPSYILNKPMTFFVSTGSELAAALSSNIANKTIICSNDTLPSIRESLVIPTNTPVKGDNFIYGCRVAFQTFDNTIPTQLPAVYGFSGVETSNIFFYSDFEHWSNAAYPNNVNIDSVQVHIRNVRNGNIAGNVAYNVTDTKGTGAYLKYEATEQFSLTPDGVKDFWDNTAITDASYSLAGANENKDHILKVDDTHIMIVAGSGKIRKTSGSLYDVDWADTASSEIVLTDGELRWVVMQWDVGETALKLAYLQYMPTTLEALERTILIGRVWVDGTTLNASGRHMLLSSDPYVSRSEAWTDKAYNLSVIGGVSPVDNNYIAMSSGELFRFPICEAITKRHIFNYSGVTQVLDMWDHLQGQSVHGTISDSGSGGSDDITELSDWWDNNGTLDTLGGNKWVAHLVGVYAVSGERVLFRGQYEYNNVGSAKVGIYADPFAISDWASDGDQISKCFWIIMKKNSNNYSDTSKVIFVPYDKSGGGGGALSSLFALNFLFSREGFGGASLPTYSGGNADLPYTVFTEDGTELNLDGHEVVVPVDSVITVAQYQFSTMAGDATAYIKVNGTKTDIGTVTQASTVATFQIDISVTAGQKILFGFYSASSGSFTSPACTAYIRTTGA